MYLSHDCTCITGALCWDCGIIVHSFIVLSYGQANLFGCASWRKLDFYYKYLCQDNVLVTDFTVPEQIGSCLVTDASQ